MINKHIDKYFEDNITVYYINLSRHKCRNIHMKKQFKKHNINAIRVDAVDSTIDSNEYNYMSDICIGKNSITENALISSVLKVFKHILLNNPNGIDKWFMICEDDIMFDKNFKNIIMDKLYKNTSLVYHLDNRQTCTNYGYPYWGTSCELYHYSVVKMLYKEMNPNTSEFIYKYDKFVYPITNICPVDYLIFNILRYYNIPITCLPLVISDIFPTSIQVKSKYPLKIRYKQNFQYNNIFNSNKNIFVN